MISRQMLDHQETESVLYPYPRGWFLIGPSQTLASGKLVEKLWMGRSIVIWRDSAGTICVANAYCPHLGAHLGPSSGGILRDGNLICPFHGFEYDIRGNCVATPSVPPPRSARLSCYPVVEKYGLVFAYYSHVQNSPPFDFPEFANSTATQAYKTVRLRGHPQATSENSVDFAHLGHVHGYQSLKRLQDTRIEGPFLYTSYGFTRSMLTRFLRFMKIAVEIDITVAGLGVSVVQVKGKSGLRVRQWVLATPVDGDLIDVTLMIEVQSVPRLSWLSGGIADFVHRIVARVLLNELVLEVRKDGEIWDKQAYQATPKLSAADRDIFRFRQYCEQFYPFQDTDGESTHRSIAIS